jgi:6-phosphogluconolactonase
VSRRFWVLPDAPSAAAAAADRLIAAGRNAIRRRGRFMLSVTGGSTPLAVCPLLVVPPRVRQLDWSRVEIFFGDERAVGPEHPDSNYGRLRAALLDHLPGVQAHQVHRMQGEAADLDAAARAYEGELQATFGVSGRRPPTFDLIWLGMGPDGHTASLFPGSSSLQEKDRWVVATWAPGPAAWRMTLTFPVLNAAREAMFLVLGADKAPALRAVRAEQGDLPAARVHARRTLWIVDAAAAGEALAA